MVLSYKITEKFEAFLPAANICITPISDFALMSIRTHLLISDDPDDHLAFSEAISSISANSLMLIALDSEKAVEWLKAKGYATDSIILDLTTHGLNIERCLQTIESHQLLSRIPLLLYGDRPSFALFNKTPVMTFFKKDYTFTELREFMSGFLAGSQAPLN